MSDESLVAITGRHLSGVVSRRVEIEAISARVAATSCLVDDGDISKTHGRVCLVTQRVMFF